MELSQELHELLNSEEDPALLFELLGQLGKIKVDLGRDSFNPLYLAKVKNSAISVAVKIIPLSYKFDLFMDEICAMKRSCSPYCVAFYGAYMREDELWLVMEFCENAISVSKILRVLRERHKGSQGD